MFLLRTSRRALLTAAATARGLRFSSSLVSPEFIASHFKNENTVVLDCGQPDAFRRAHIPGAKLLPYGPMGLKNTSERPQKSMIPEGEFEVIMSMLGVQNDTTLIFYDDELNMKSTRAWWVARHYGHPVEKLKVLDGGWKTWVDSSSAVGTGNPLPVTQTDYSINKKLSECTVHLPEIKQMLNNPTEVQFVDVRSDAEFDAGHIPNAIQLEWIETINPLASNAFRPGEELAIIVEEAGLVKDKPVVTYCHLGVRAAHIAFVLKDILGFPNVRVYEASMMEYLSRDDTEVEV